MTREDFFRRVLEREGYEVAGADASRIHELATEAGLTTQSFDQFRGGDDVTRSEAAIVFLRAAGEELPEREAGTSWTDYQQQVLQKAVDVGLYVGYGGGALGTGSETFEASFFDDVAGRLDGIDWDSINDFEQWEALVRERFPGWAWALDHEEIGPLLKSAAEGDFTVETFNAQLRATDWFSSRSAAERTWDAFTADPANEAEVERRLEARRGAVNDLIGQLGAEIPDEDVEALVLAAERQGLSDDEIIGRIFTGATNFTAGSITASEGAVRDLASSYLVSIDAQTQRSLAGKLATGEMNEGGLLDYVRSVAKNQYPQFADLIDKGVNVSEYMAPQQQLIANMLGMNMADVDFTGNFRDVLSIGDGNQVRAMSMSETERFVRSTDEYWQGQAGQDELFTMASGLSRAMGIRR